METDKWLQDRENWLRNGNEMDDEREREFGDVEYEWRLGDARIYSENSVTFIVCAYVCV